MEAVLESCADRDGARMGNPLYPGTGAHRHLRRRVSGGRSLVPAFLTDRSTTPEAVHRTAEATLCHSDTRQCVAETRCDLPESGKTGCVIMTR